MLTCSAGGELSGFSVCPVVNCPVVNCPTHFLIGSLVGCEGTQLIVHELLSAVLGTLEGKEMVAEQIDCPARHASQAACVSEVLSIVYFLQLQKSLGFVSPHTVIPCIFLH